MIPDLERMIRDAAFGRFVRRFVNGDGMSSQPCGCDPEANNYMCERHLKEQTATFIDNQHCPDPAEPVRIPTVFGYPVRGLPVMDSDRKALPIFTGVLLYFPDALLEVARVSRIGNDQHNPGQPLHWAREKSTDQLNTAARHMLDHGMGRKYDTDGAYHIAKAAWRLLAELQLTVESDRGRNQKMQEIVP